MRRFHWYIMLACSSVLLLMAWFRMAQAAPEAPAATPGTLSEILTEVLKLAVAVALPVLAALVHRAVSFAKDKAGIDVPAKQEALINEWVEQGVHFAEEKARNWLADKKIPMPGSYKLASALDYVWDHMQRSGIVEWSRDQLQAKIESKVNYRRPLMMRP